jgi:hypothetical protein
MAEELMAAGADLVLMHHAHVLQGVEVMGSSVCCYNLGNFLLDSQEGNVIVPVMQKEQNETAVFVFEVTRRGLISAIALPAYMDSEDCRLRWACGARGMEILSRLQRISLDLDGDYASLFERQRAERNTGSTLRVLAFHARRGHWRYVLGELSRFRPEHIRMILRSTASLVAAPIGRLSSAGRQKV